MSTKKTKYLICMSVFLVGLWLTACKSTPGTSTPLPPQPQAGETKDTPQTTSSPPAGSKQPEARQKSKTGQPPSPEDSAAHQPESKEKSPDRQTATAGEAGARPPETDQDMPQNRRTAPQTADDRLAKARDDLRVSQATERRIAAELEKLKKSGNASAEEIRNYETYLERVRAMAAENRKMVEKMETAYAEHPSSRDTSSESSKLSDEQIPEEQVRDPVAELDRQLDSSLTAFDGQLLKEMEKIQTASTAKMRGLAQEAAEAAKRAKGRGGKYESQGETSEQEEGEDGDQTSDNDKKSGSDKSKDSGDEDKADSGKDREEEPRGVESSDDSKNLPGKGKGGYGREDEDIVARQLREAAENETDPELKKKLWAEYEEYMKNTQ